MDNWALFLKNVEKCVDKIRHPLFRGQNSIEMQLIPSLFRIKSYYADPSFLEDTLHVEFSTCGGQLYDHQLPAWEILFEIRNAGLPTRLLDWTEDFASALFFALRDIDWAKNAKKKNPLQPCIWILNPHKLNKKMTGDEGIPSIDILQTDYRVIFDETIKVNEKEKLKYTGPFVFLPSRSRQRISAQKSVYTIHDEEHDPLEIIAGNCVRRFDIPLDSIKRAKNFLILSGTTEYSLFPDVDGLGRYLTTKYHIRKM